jgi:amidohydrolase
MFLFQPAEEGVPVGERGGARMMVEDGVFSKIKPDAVIAFHTNGAPPDDEGDNERLGTVAYTSGPTYAAATRWEATIKGRPAHGSTPHLSVDSIVTASEIVLALQTIRSRMLSPQSDNVLTTAIFRSGERHNIIPESAFLGGTIRTFDDATLETIETRMREIFDGYTKAAHATYDLSFDTGHPVTVNNPELTAQLVPTLERLLGQGQGARRSTDHWARRISRTSHRWSRASTFDSASCRTAGPPVATTRRPSTRLTSRCRSRCDS